MFDRVIAVRGGGDLGSGVVVRLWRAGFSVVVLESPSPTAVRRSVAFAETVYEARTMVEDVPARLEPCDTLLRKSIQPEWVPVVVDDHARCLELLRPDVVIDAIMAKFNTGTRRDMAPLVIALGPGFTAGDDVDAVIETNRGPNLGRVIWSGSAEADTGSPGSVQGKQNDRVLRAPVAGIVECVCRIGDIVTESEVIALVDGKQIRSPFPGLIRGLIHSGCQVESGTKIGDIDPRLDPELCRLVSDKALAVAGGVLEAILIRMKEE